MPHFLCERVMKQKETWGTLEVAFAYVCWGLLTIFWNLLSQVNSVYILAQRILWSMIFMGIYMLAFGKWQEISHAIRDKKVMITCFICGVLVSVNWGVYIFAVNSGHVLDASMGYFIEPVLVALIGMLAFREQPSRMEKITFLCAVLGLLFMIVRTRTFPTMALFIAGSFAVYGAVKKKLGITAHASLFLETLCMTGFALLFTIYAEASGQGSMGVLSGMQFLLIPACGVVTSIPLLLFNVGVREIPYYFAGILMYINPTLQFLMGLFYFHEKLDTNRLIAFCLIWFGILFTIYEKVQTMRKERAQRST